jgi:hypothetical protein
MREVLIALLIFGVLAGGGLAVRTAIALHLNILQFLYPGGILIVGGLVFSIPFAFWYHWKLYTTLGPRGDLSPRWIWSPTAQHVRLRPEERRRVLPWFYAGAAGWTICMLGVGICFFGYFVDKNQ